MGSVVYKNPKHSTPEFPESMQVRGVVEYMTITQKRVMEASVIVTFLSVFGMFAVGIYINDKSK